jgi:serine/threonine-protein kinase HipA
MAAFGFQTAAAKIKVFGKTVALVIERFGRRWMDDGRLLRLPQEDFCQALSCPPGLKYQNHGGPGIVEGLNLLKASDTPTKDQKAFLKAQVLFWLIGLRMAMPRISASSWAEAADLCSRRCKMC